MIQNRRRSSHGKTRQAKSPRTIGETFWASESGFEHVLSALVIYKELKLCTSYQRAYLDFFEDRLVDFGYDWKKLLEYYLYEGKQPLINSFLSGRR